MTTSQPLVYGEKWSLWRQPGGFFHNLGTVGFSFSGRHVAFGGAQSLLLASIDEEDILVILRSSGMDVVALHWFLHDSFVCAFEDGMICDVSLIEVSVVYLYLYGTHVSL